MNFSLRILALNFFIIANFIFLFTDEKNLPDKLDQPNFRALIKDDDIYVDKTRYLHLMLKKAHIYFFLTRPRRFGKSLLVDMMEKFFRGDKELFKGLYIHDECPNRPYPVIKIDFSEGISVFSIDEFRKELTLKLINVAKSYGINDLDINMSPESALSELILTLDSGNHSKVVVLIDEYDYVYTKSYMKTSGPEILEELQNFYSTLKGLHDNIHFCFVTGITRIAIMSNFITFDLTMDPAYASIVGFTQDELEENFGDYIQNIADIRTNGDKIAILQEMKFWLDGFRFTSSDERVYNPCSVVSYLSSNGSEKNFWTESGGSKFYYQKMEESPINFLNMVRLFRTNNTKLRNVSLTVSEYQLREQTDLSPTTSESLETLLFHCGYLSIDRTCVGPRPHTMCPSYSLRFTNQEVKTEFITRISLFLFGPLKHSYLQKVAKAVKEAIDSYQWENFIKVLNTYYAQTQPRSSYTDSKVRFYQVLFHCVMAVAGFNWIELEVTTALLEEADVVMESENVTYITKTKLVENKENPLRQCLKKYSGKFLEFHKERIVCIGLVFSVEKQIVKWGVAVLSKKGDVLEHYGNIGIEEEKDTKLKTVEDSGIDEKIEMSPEEIKIATVVKAYLSEHQLSTLPLEQVIKFLRQMKGTRNDLELFKTMTADLATFCNIIKRIVQSPPKVLKQGPLKTKITKFFIKFCV